MSEPSKRPYHDHLDVCEQCAAHPFDLCAVGSQKIYEEFRITMLDWAGLDSSDGLDTQK